MNAQRARRGFTAVELVIVLAIISLVAGMAMPRYASASARYRLKAAARRLAADISLARDIARAKSASTTVAFKVGTDGHYRVGGVRGADGSTEFQVKLWQAPYEVVITGAEVGSQGEVKFNGFGVSEGATVKLTTRGWTATVVLDGPSGMVTVVDP